MPKNGAAVPRRKYAQATLALTLALVTTASMAVANKTPSAKELADTKKKVEQQQQLLNQQNTQLAAKQEQLAYLAEQAGLALQAYDEAVKASDEALHALMQARDTLAAAQNQVEVTKTRLGNWAATAYRKGSSTNSTLEQLHALRSGGMATLAERQWAMRKTGQNRADLVDQADAAQVAADEAADVARKAEILAQQRKGKAAELKKAADQAVAKQRQEVAAMQKLVANTESSLAADKAKADRLAEAIRIAEAERLAAMAKPGGREVVMGPTGTCKGGDISVYANGRIPKSVLCPLWGAPGHFLRADAAAAFERMAKAYARDFGQPMRLTDSYRNYATQVSLKRRKPHLAATPGRSNHGWARAIDFGGGINKFGTVQHNWMRANAPLYGWYHPTWARKNGSKPEAWHWEYAPT